MRIFLSHISEEAAEARALKKVLEQALPDSEFLSAPQIFTWAMHGSKRLTRL
jgi:hypothetical protein